MRPTTGIDPAFLKSLGYAGSINDMHWQYFRDQTVNTGALNDLAYQFYGRYSSGLTLNDRYQYWLANIGTTPRRASIVGSQIRVNGVDTYFEGVNQGTWDENFSIDAPNIKALGSNVVRIVGVRWWGDDYGSGVDGYSSDPNNHYIDPAHLRQALREVDWAVAAGLWVVFTFDSNNGAGNRGLNVAIPNFFESTPEGIAKYAQWKIMQQHVVKILMSRPNILAYEVLAEPLPADSDNTWAAPLRTLYRDLIANVRAVDTRTPFLIGPRDSYGLNFINESYLSERTDCMYTADFLSNKVRNDDGIAAQMETMAAFRTTNNVPVFLQQVGRNSNEDDGNSTTTENIGLTGMNGTLSVMRALKLPFTWWQYHQNTGSPTAYALYYKTVYPGPTGPDNWTPKVNEIASYSYHMNITGASLEAAAIAAATAAGAKLFYVKSDLSNVWQANDTSTPVTATGQTVGRIDPVVGSGNFTQATVGLRPTLIAVPNGYGMNFVSASNQWLALDTTYFASGDDTVVIVACRPETSAANRTLFMTGSSGTTVRNPYMTIVATDNAQAGWRDDASVGGTPQSTTLCDNRAIVMTAWKSGVNKKVFLNGVQEGTTDTTAMTTMTITRTRLGATSAGTNGFGGPIALVCLAKTMTDEQRRAIERWGAWLVAAPFRGAIPA